jgi:hypothetical protein
MGKLKRGKIHLKRALAYQLGIFFKDKKTAAVTVAFFAFLSFIAGWLPDGIANLLLTENKKDGLVMISASLLCLFFLWLAGTYYARELEFDVVEEEPQKKKALILFLSEIRDKSSQELNDEIKILDTAENESDRLSKLQGSSLSKWRMPVEAIKYHLPKLERIVVVTSSLSSTQLESFRLLIVKLFGEEEAKKILQEKIEDFESVSEIFEKLNKIYKDLEKEGFKAKHVIVDVTGGQKTASIAGALATTVYADREFQYVSTNTYQVKSYDVGLVSDDKF